MENEMHIGVSYGDANDQVWMRIEVPEGVTVKQAIELSGLLKRFPDINLDKQKVGIYGKVVKLDAEVKESDRIEVYRAIIADPNKVPRRDADDDDDDD
jgi:putative ubiquitin-RnfH superfamily antitoxin RatB of RatAB toxin-antitoxin module